MQGKANTYCSVCIQQKAETGLLTCEQDLKRVLEGGHCRKRELAIMSQKFEFLHQKVDAKC